VVQEETKDFKTNTMKKKIGNYVIKVKQEEQPESPDNWGDEERFLVYDHRQFYVKRDGFTPKEIFLETKKKKTYKGFWVFPVYAYIHSGVSLSVGSHNFPDARWDVSMSGFALIKRESGTYTEKLALNAAEGLIEMWNQYLSGEVYEYRIFEKSKDENGNKQKEMIDSSSGFYCENGCMLEAESIVNHIIEKHDLTIEV
jgi:hypothetical protein